MLKVLADKLLGWITTWVGDVSTFIVFESSFYTEKLKNNLFLQPLLYGLCRPTYSNVNNRKLYFYFFFLTTFKSSMFLYISSFPEPPLILHSTS